MERERKPPSPSWRAFLDNHVKDLVAVDFFVVPTATFGVLFGFLVLAHDGEIQLLRILSGYFEYYNRSRCHLSLVGDAPEPRLVQGPELGKVVEQPEVGGLHHRYARAAA